MSEPLLRVEGLCTRFFTEGGVVHAVEDLSIEVRAGETLGIVGESGSGKSVTSLSVMGLLPDSGARVVSGSIRFLGRDLRAASAREMTDVRGSEIAMIFQEPMTSLNPVFTVGNQIAESVRLHQGLGSKESLDRAVEMMRLVGIPSAEQRVQDYPHQLSGGMRQRVLIAIALACEPRLLIADEPTTALDVTIQAQILELLGELVVGTGTALVLITHDLGVVAGLCDEVHVMYSGRVVESAPRRPLFASPRHPYTGGLLASIPRLDSPRGQPLQPIPGSPNDALPWHDACAFAPRCGNRLDVCTSRTPALEVSARGHAESLRCFHPLDADQPAEAPAEVTP